ncbi:MAG: ABC transporter substrate-binding protein [Hydrogenophilus thermoluteolus]
MFRVSRRAFLRHSAALALVPLITSCAPTPPLKVATWSFPAYDLLRWRVADNAAIRWIPTAGDAETTFLLRFHRADVALLTLDLALREAALGTPLTVIGLLDVSHGADMVLVREGFTTPERFASARVAVAHTGVGAVTYALARQALGLPLSWENTVAIPVAEQIAAWQAGQIDAAVTFEPFANRLRALGAVPLIDSSRLPPLILDVIVARSDVLDALASSLKTLTTAWFSALDAWRHHPDETAHALAPYLGVEPGAVPALFSGVHLLDCAANQEKLRTGLHAEQTAIWSILTAAGFPLPPEQPPLPTSVAVLPPCSESPR